MNVINHRTYTLEFDVWEATQKVTEVEIDHLIFVIKNQMGHCGNVKLTLVSEARHEKRI